MRGVIIEQTITSFFRRCALSVQDINIKININININIRLLGTEISININIPNFVRKTIYSFTKPTRSCEKYYKCQVV